MKILDCNNKRINLIVSLVILTIIFGIGVVTSVNFIKFRNYEAKFVVRDDVVGRVYKFSEFSKHLKGDVADSNIYEIQGTENTVALVNIEKADEYNSLEAIKNLKAVAVADSLQSAAAKKTLTNVTEVSSKELVVQGLNDGTYDVGILSYKDASLYEVSNAGVVISEAEVEKVPSLLVIGGTHPNEPSGQLTATLVLENATMERGILYVITELNRSAYSYSQPQEATTWYYHLTTQSGKTRTFKFGSRATNTVDQWPTPDVYSHSSGQKLSSSEVRNINRAYPGSEEGTYTEQIAYVVTNFVNTKDVTMVIDLHEASPEYLTINACVFHQDSADIISGARSSATAFRYQENGKKTKLDISFNESPTNMHGLTHREVGDYTNAYVFLFETSNASQGKIRGPFTEELIKYSSPDKFYTALVNYDKEHGTQIIYGAPCEISERVARHTLSITSVIDGFNKVQKTRVVNVTARDNVGVGGVEVGEFKMGNIPSYNEIMDNGVGYYLLDVE